ncbi:MAG: hypothetical protein FJ279_34405, partial [Planctomycetes bacterium]|nr:hypothetical protein [Planctomycetota bacterium]
MCYRGVAWLLLALGLVVCCAAHAQQRISGGSIEITLSEAGALIGLKDAIGRDTTATAAGLRFLTGAPGQADSLVEPKCAGAGNQRQLAGRLQRSGVEVKATFDGQPDRITLTVELGNPSVEQRLVEVELALPCPYAGKEKWTFFDGRVDVGAPTSKVNRNGLGGLFPLAAICDAETGLAIGIHAFEHHSWLSATVDPTASPPEFAYAVRRVLDPKGSERATFVLFGFNGKWGTAMAVDRYYDLFPEAFRLPPGVDRRFALAGGYVHGGGRERELRWEESRRLYHGWQPSWSFRRTGDWMPDAARWPKTAGDLDAHLSKVRAEYATAGPGNPICHYVEPTQCEADLAEKEFADSIIWSRTGPTRRFLHAVP